MLISLSYMSCFAVTVQLVEGIGHILHYLYLPAQAGLTLQAR